MCKACPQWIEFPQASFEDYIQGNYYQEKKALSAIGEKVYKKLLSLPRNTVVTRKICFDIINELNSNIRHVYEDGYYFVIKIFCDILKIPTDISLSNISEELIDFDANLRIDLGNDLDKQSADKDKDNIINKLVQQYIHETYKIYYDANGGIGAPSSQTKSNNTTLVLSSIKPTRNGYTFRGWSTISTASSPTYYAGGSYVANSSVTLYAVWSYNGWNSPHGSRYNNNNHAGIKTCAILFPIISFIIGQIIEFIVYGVSGRLFLADLIFSDSQWWELWVMLGLGALSVVFTILSSMRIIDDDHEGLCWAYLIISGLLFLTIPAIAISVCLVVSIIIFLCYLTDKEESISWKLAIAIIVLMVFYIWAGISNNKQYTITFDFQGGYGDTQSVEAKYNKDMPEAEMPQRTGYIFLGYFDSPVSAINDDSHICYYNANMESATKWDKKKDMTLYARWQAKEYRITFDKQGGTGGTDSVVAKYDGPMPSALAPSKLGYAFKGYYTDKNGEGTCYYNSAMDSNKKWDLAFDDTLYAHWAANPIYVSSSPSSLLNIDSSVSTTIYVSGGTGSYSYEIINSPSGISCELSENKLSVIRTSYSASGIITIKVLDMATGASANCNISYSTVSAPSSGGSSSGGGGECIAAGTKVLLSTHEHANVETLSVGDKIMVWDFKSSSFIESSITLLVDHGIKEYLVLTLNFDDNTSIRIIGGHVFFDLTQRRYVTINESNYQAYFGHNFMTYGDDFNYSSRKLVDATISSETTGAYAIVTDTYYNCITNNIVTATPTIPGIYQLVSSYLDENLNFDHQQFLEDVNKYGTYDYELFKEYISYEQYIQLCAPYFKLAEIKGFTTFEEIYELMVMYSYVY